MDRCASVLLAFPPSAVANDPSNNDQYEKAVQLHYGKVNKLYKDHLADLAANAVQLLSHLDPAVHSISFLAVLDTLLPTDSTKPTEFDPTLAEFIVTFLCSFDARQIRYSGVPFTNLFTAVGSGNILPASIAVELLTKALQRLDPTGVMMTSNHLTLAKLAYYSGHIEPALPIISANVVFYPGMPNSHPDHRRLCDPKLHPQGYLTRENGFTSSLRPAQILEYDYLIGLMYCSLRDWAAATAAFERVITYPTRDAGVSKIMVEAHKKWVLTSLLYSGKTGGQPALASGSANRAYGILSKHYLQIAEHFESFDVTALRTAFSEHLTDFVDDSNEGLVREVLSSFQRWQIYCLRDVYSKISLADIRATTFNAETGDHLGSDEAVEELVRDMIISGMLSAAIREAADTRPAYLEFLPESETQVSEAEYAQALAVSARRLQHLKSILGAVDERLLMSREYGKYLVKEQQRREKAGRDDGKGDPSGFDEQIEDEDLMGGMMSMH